LRLARATKNNLLDAYVDKNRCQKASRKLGEGIEDAFQYTVVGKGHIRLKNTNLIERLNQGVRRREKSFIFLKMPH